MIELRTLGTLDLRAADGREVATVLAHSKRTALLAYLAVAAPRGFHRRDALLALLWPELDQERARASLRKAVYHLRRSLGEDVLVGRGDEELASSDAGLWCDAVAFEQALDAGETARAFELYRGHFLQAFFVADVPDFERWVERERVRLRDRAFHGAWAAAEREEQAGNSFGAAYWGRRAAALSPDDEGAVRRLIALLDRLGDRAGAVAAYEEFSRRLARDYDVEPAVETQVLIRTVRSRVDPGETGVEPPPAASGAPTPASSVRLASPPSPFPPLVPPQASAPAASATAPAPSPSPAAPPDPEHGAFAHDGGDPRGAPPRRAVTPGRRRVTRRAAALLALVGVGMAAAWTLGQRRAPAAEGAGPPRASTLAVLPFSFRGSPEFEYLADGMVTLLSTGLDGASGVQTVDAAAVLTTISPEERRPLNPEAARRVAARVGAGLFVLGDVVEAGGRLRISAVLHDRARGASPPARAAAEGDAGSLFALIDDLARQLLAGHGEGRLAQVAARTTHSLPALKAYLEGERHFRSGHYKEAIGAFQQAAALDSTFALAYYRLALAFSWASDTMAIPAATQAERFSRRLSPPDRLLVEAIVPYLRGEADEAERRYRNILSTRPSEVEAWYPLGEVLFHYNPVRGRPIGEARPAFQRALALGPRDGPLTHLLEIEAIEGNHRTFDSLLVGIAPGAHFDVVGRAVRALTLGSESDRLRIMAELRATTDADLTNIGRHMLFLVHDRAAVRRVVELLTEPPRPAEVRALGHILLAHTEAAAGRWRAAAAALRAAEPLDRTRALEHAAFLRSLPFLPVGRREIGATRDALADWTPDPQSGSGVVFPDDRRLHALFRSYLLGLLGARLGDHDLALELAARTERWRATGQEGVLAVALAGGIRARVAWERRDAGAALASLDLTDADRPKLELLSIAPFATLFHERYVRALALDALGRGEEALGWYGSFAEHSPFGRVFLAPAHRRQAEIYEALGRPADAAAHYRRFVDLWRDCDPELRPLLADARRRLARLGAADSAAAAVAAGAAGAGDRR
jgi:serine/threonine-protein kinase